MINEKLLVLGFEPFHSRYLSLRLVHMTVVKYPLINTTKKRQKRTITTTNRYTVVKLMLRKVYFIVVIGI